MKSKDLDLMELTNLAGGESRDGAYTGTKALMLAILEDGVRSYLSSVPRVRAEAELWISTRRQRSPFSFHVVCETLGLEPSAVKAALRRLRAQGPAARATLIRRSRPNVRRNGRLTVRRSA